MTFEEASRRYSELNGRRLAGRMTPREFYAAVTQLRVQDAKGVWWTLDPGGGGWLWWNGSAWAPAQPAGASTDQARASAFGPASARARPRPRRPWEMISVVGGFVAGAVYYYYSTLRADYEGSDWQSAALIALMPVALMLLRKPTDTLLRPLQSIRSKIPPLVLVGAGLVAPYLAAYYLYDQELPGVGRLIQYEYMRVTLVVGTLLSYVILRTPMKR